MSPHAITVYRSRILCSSCLGQSAEDGSRVQIQNNLGGPLSLNSLARRKKIYEAELAVRGSSSQGGRKKSQRDPCLRRETRLRSLEGKGREGASSVSQALCGPVDAGLWGKDDRMASGLPTLFFFLCAKRSVVF